MTIQGAIAELQNLLEVDDVPSYYKGGIEKVIETIVMEFDKDINVRSKDEPYIDIETGILHWCGWKYRRIYEDEPQTERSE